MYEISVTYLFLKPKWWKILRGRVGDKKLWVQAIKSNKTLK